MGAFWALAHMFIIFMRADVPLAISTLPLLMNCQKMFLLFRNRHMFRATKTLEIIGTLGDVSFLIFRWIVRPTIPAGDDTETAFGLDMMVKIVLGALEIASVRFVKTRVIFLWVMRHHEKILFIRIDGTQFRTSYHDGTCETLPRKGPFRSFLVQLEVLPRTQKTDPSDGITGWLSWFILTWKTCEPDRHTDMLVADVALDIHGSFLFCLQRDHPSEIIFVFLFKYQAAYRLG
jgi:hypothetical protein